MNTAEKRLCKETQAGGGPGDKTQFINQRGESEL